jgi:hypothetical protein
MVGGLFSMARSFFVTLCVLEFPSLPLLSWGGARWFVPARPTLATLPFFF